MSVSFLLKEKKDIFLLYKNNLAALCIVIKGKVEKQRRWRDKSLVVDKSCFNSVRPAR